MAQLQQTTYACSACGRKLRWKPEIVGKKTKCPCGHVQAVPDLARQTTPPEDDYGEYDIAQDEVVRMQPVAAVVPPTPVVPSPLAAIPPKRSAFELEEREEWEMPKNTWEIVAATSLIFLGIVLNFWEAMRTGQEPRPFEEIAVYTSGLMALNVGLVIAALYGIAMTMPDIVLDTPWRLIVKAAAVALVPGPLGSLVDHLLGGDINGNIAGVFTTVGAYAGLVILLFRLPFLAMAAVVFAVFVIRTLVAYLVYRVEGMRSDSWI